MKKKGLIITIDGPSGVGKGTVGRIISKKLGYLYLDTGAMYRASALATQREGIKLDDEEELKKMLSKISISFREDSNGETRVLLNGEDVTDEIRTLLISHLSSNISKKGVVRRALQRMQREIGEKGGVVAEGRDTGTYVFPDADFKFYLDADLGERARRRWLQLRDMGIHTGLELVEREIEERDRQDKERDDSPLHPAQDAYIINTTNLGVDETVDRILKIIPNNALRG